MGYPIPSSTTLLGGLENASHLLPSAKASTKRGGFGTPKNRLHHKAGAIDKLRKLLLIHLHILKEAAWPLSFS
jgi:hypothetical protein